MIAAYQGSLAQISFNCALLIITIIASTALIVGYLYQFYSRNKENGQDNSRIAVKIDRRGNYRYETIPDTEQDNVALFWKIVLIIAAIALLLIPIDAFLNRV
ncbi:MAG: hypothetical protein WBG46_06155 [Nonlabens sp.]